MENPESGKRGKKWLLGLFTKKADLIIGVVLAVVVTHYVTRWLERKGEPEISARINAVMIRQNFETEETYATVYMMVTNLQGEETFLTTSQLSITLPSVETRPAVINVKRSVHLGAFQNVDDTINCEMPERHKIVRDTSVVVPVSVEMKLQYPSGKIAKEIRLDYSDADTTIMGFQYIWYPSPKNLYLQLSELARRNELPPEWKRWDINFRGQTYACYYSPSEMELIIEYRGETMTVVPKGLGEDRRPKMAQPKVGEWSESRSLRFVPDPKIEYRFVDLHKQSLVVSYEIREQGRVVKGEYTLTIYEGYRHTFWVKK